VITASDLYAIGMESDTAYSLMPELCALLEMPFPPQLIQGKPAPVTLALTTKENYGIHCN
jgi:hypothetical protein